MNAVIEARAVRRCQCKPSLVASFAKGELVAVKRRHWVTKGCSLPTEQIDVDQWKAHLPRGGRHAGH